MSEKCHGVGLGEVYQVQCYSVAVFQCGTAANPPVMYILYLAVNWEVATAQKEDGHQEE